MQLLGYNPNTGEILGIYCLPEESAEYMQEHDSIFFLEAEGRDDTHYMDIAQTPHKIMLRPSQEITQSTKQIFADGNDALILSNLPMPCRVIIGNNSYTVQDGCLEWSTRVKGTFTIRVIAFPYRDWKGEITAT